jgi:sugar lactone lactonase YvrE
VRRGPAAALVALACLAAVPATALAAPGDIAVADEGPWLGATGSVLLLPPGGGARPLATGAPLRDPAAIAVAGDGTFLVTDAGSEGVYRVTKSGNVVTIVRGAGLDDPVGIALAPAGKAYLSDRGLDAVMRLDLTSGALSPVAHVTEASGLAMDKAGKLLVADRQALRRVDPGTGAITTVASGAPLVDPRDVAVEQDGTIFVVGDRQVVRVDPADGAMKVLVSGAPLSYPSAIDIDAKGDLVVSDRGAMAGVIRVDRETGAMTTAASGPPFFTPTGIGFVGGAGVDPSGGGNGDPDGPAAPPPPTPPGGTGGSGGTPGTPGGTPGGGGTTITLPNGTVITLPPGITPGTSGIAGVDFTAPSFLRKPKLSVRRFRAAHHGRAFVSLSVGTFINYALSEVARLTISVQKFRPLSRICRRRLAQQSRHRTGTRCRKYVSLKGRYVTASAAGVGKVRFRGRLKGRTLKPGRYRFVIRATDGAGNTSKPRRPVFRIVR